MKRILCSVLLLVLVMPTTLIPAQSAQEKAQAQEKTSAQGKTSEKASEAEKKKAEARVEVVPIEELLPSDVLAFAATTNLSGLVNNVRRLDAFKALETRLPKAVREGRDNPLNEVARFLSFGIKDAGVLDETRLGFALFKPAAQPVTPPSDLVVAPKQDLRSRRNAARAANNSGASTDDNDNQDKMSFPPPKFVAFIEAPRLELTRPAREQFIKYYSEIFDDLGKPEEAKQVKYRGATIERFKNGFVGLMIGTTYVLGEFEAIDNVLTVRTTRDAPRLSDNLDFVRARAQLSTPMGLFAYLNSKSLAEMTQGWLNLGQLYGLDGTDQSNALLDVYAIKSVALASNFEREGVVDRLLVSLDPSKKNLLTMLLKGPASEFQAGRYTPAGTKLFINQSVDWPQVYDDLIVPMLFGLQAASQEMLSESREREQNSPNAPPDEPLRRNPGWQREFQEKVLRRQKEIIARYERELGFKLREELAKDFGSEVSVAYELPKSPSASPNDKATHYAVYLSVRDREAARAAFSNLAVYLFNSMGANMVGNNRTQEEEREAQEPPKEKTDEQIKQEQAQRAALVAAMPREVYKKTELVSLVFMSVGFFDDYIVIADSNETLKRLLDTPESGTPISLDSNYRTAMAGAPNASASRVYLSPSYFDGLLNSFLQGWLAKATTEPLTINAPATLAAFIEGSDRSLKLEAFSPVGIPGIFATMIADDSVRTRTSANEGQTVATLHQIIITEKNYAESHNGRYATLDDLTKAKLIKLDLEALKKEFHNYRYELKLKPNATGFELTATPVNYGRQGRRSYFVDESGKIHFADKNGEVATAKDEVLPMSEDKEEQDK